MLLETHKVLLLAFLLGNTEEQQIVEGASVCRPDIWGSEMCGRLEIRIVILQ